MYIPKMVPGPCILLIYMFFCSLIIVLQTKQDVFVDMIANWNGRPYLMPFHTEYTFSSVVSLLRNMSFIYMSNICQPRHCQLRILSFPKPIHQLFTHSHVCMILSSFNSIICTLVYPLYCYLILFWSPYLLYECSGSIVNNIILA